MKKKMPNPIILGFVGGIIAIIGTIIMYWSKMQYDLDSKEKNKIRDVKIKSIDSTTQKIDTVSTENLGLTKQIDTTVNDSKSIGLQTSDDVQILKQRLNEQNKQLNSSQATIDKLRSENITLHEKVAYISNNIYNNVTGGDSYLSAILFNNSDGSYRLSAFIEGKDYNSEGKFPLRNTSLNLFIDGNLFDAAENKDYKTNEELRLTTNRNPMGLYYLPNDKNYISYGLKIFATNSKYVQLITFKKYKDNKWYMHIIQYNDQYGKSIRCNKYWDNYPEDLKEMYKQADLDGKKIFSESVEIRF